MEKIQNSLADYLKAQGIADVTPELSLAPENTGCSAGTAATELLTAVPHTERIGIRS